MNFLPKYIQKRYLSLTFLLLVMMLFLVNHIFNYKGHFGFDDMSYAQLAHQVTTGSFQLDDFHFSYRWVPVLFTGGVYYLFGLSDHSSAIPPLIITLMTLLLALTFFKTSQKMAAIAAIAFTGFNFWTAFYADKIMPDVYVAFFVFAAIASVYHHRFTFTGRKSWLFAALFSLAAFLGILSKETILLVVPVYAFVFFSDILQRRFLHFWGYTFVFLALIAVVYLALIWWQTGDVFHRIYAIRSGSYFNPCSYDQLPLSHTIYRISHGFGWMLIQAGAAISMVFALPIIFAGSMQSLWKLQTKRSFFGAVLLMALLAGNFMSISASAYVPMCPDIRHFLYLIPLAAIPAGWIAVDFINSKKNAVVLAVLVSIVAGLSLIFHLPWKITYIPMFGFILFLITLPRLKTGKRSKILFFILLILLIASPLLASLFSPKSTNNYPVQKELITTRFENNHQQNIIITDVAQRNMGRYHLKFDTTYTRFYAFRDMNEIPRSDSVNYYLLINPFTQKLSGQNPGDLPEEIMWLMNEGTVVLEREGVVLYKLGRLPKD